jgi:hypothetical protein
MEPCTKDVDKAISTTPHPKVIKDLVLAGVIHKVTVEEKAATQSSD